MPRGTRRAAPPAPAPLVGSGVRPGAALAPAYAGVAQQPWAIGAQPLAGATTAAAGARGTPRGRRQGGAPAARRGRRRCIFLRAGAGVGPRGGGDADSQLGAARSQPNGQVLHVLRAAAPSSHTPGERAHDARRAPGGSLKSHPVVGGIALTPRYSPRPRLDNVRPAAAPPEDPPDADAEPDADTEAHAEALAGPRSPLPSDNSTLLASVSRAPVGST